MKFSVFGLAIIASLAVAGCQPTQEQLAMEASQDDATCRSYGAKSGTESMVNCRVALSQGHANERARQKAAIADALDTMAVVNAMNQPRYVTPARVPVTCTTFGNTTHCN